MVSKKEGYAHKKEGYAQKRKASDAACLGGVSLKEKSLKLEQVVFK